MSLVRDSYLRLGVRKQNWLRLEQYRRVYFAQHVWRLFLLRALRRDAGLSRAQRFFSATALRAMPRKASITRHNSRCWLSGRARQVRRNTLTARMHFRSLMREGYAAHIRLGRT